MPFRQKSHRAFLSFLVCASLLLQCGAAAFAAEESLPAASQEASPPASVETTVPTQTVPENPAIPPASDPVADTSFAPVPSPSGQTLTPIDDSSDATAPPESADNSSPIFSPQPIAVPASTEAPSSEESLPAATPTAIPDGTRAAVSAPSATVAVHRDDDDDDDDDRLVGHVYVSYREWNTGDILASSTTLSGYIGTRYSTSPKLINGFELYTTVGSTSGRFLPFDQYVTYYYVAKAPVQGTVTAKYLEKSTSIPLSSPMIYTGPVGSWYSTSAQTISGYDLIEIQGNPTGYISATPQTVIYYYEKTPPAQGTVTVRYWEEGTNAALAPSDTLTGTIGSAYVTSPKSIPGYLLSSAPDNAQGTYQTSPQTVTYYYRALPPVQGTVNVQYLEQGTTTQVAPTETLTGAVGSNYTATAKSVAGYTLSGDSGNTSGQYTAEPQTVIFYYTQNPPVQGTLYVKYLEQGTGNEIAASDLLTGTVGEPYTTTPKTVAGYTLSGNSGNTSGTYTEEAQTVSYYYTKNLPVQGSVTVRYLEQTTGTALSPELTLTGAVGTTYTAEEKIIPGYTLISIDGSVEGIFAETPQTVTFYYKEAPANLGTVTVKHLDKDTSVELAAADTLQGTIGDPYATAPKALEGYTLFAISGSPEGQYQEASQTVTYYYQKTPPATSSIIVQYLDQATGKELAPAIRIYGTVGSAYTTSAPEIAGYTATGNSGNTSGTYTQSVQTVNYYYTKLPAARGSVVVLFLDQKTKAPLASQEVLSGEVGTSYITSAKMIKGYRMVLNSNNASGTFTNSEQTVVYLYEKVASVPDTGDFAAPLWGMLAVSAIGLLYCTHRLTNPNPRKKR
ncbi:MucBP domain-containing protein [Pygmaiobacter massiliensis]|uniref:MucBP domain-containing protein n=1 Tax=Pygmaiobacter massiliensis TaxID=1917873 RepID=UPI002A80B0A4|nr:MucBP domain-containing protein [Pygmaiobacter massiliensis]MDY4784860.1 MucBP domain-containing protein [Pygmaiobacter massiliensis]